MTQTYFRSPSERHRSSVADALARFSGIAPIPRMLTRSMTLGPALGAPSSISVRSDPLTASVDVNSPLSPELSAGEAVQTSGRKLFIKYPKRPTVLPNSRQGRQINCSRQRICTLPGMRRGGKLSFSLRKSAITSRHCSDEANCGGYGINPKGVPRNQRDYIGSRPGFKNQCNPHALARDE